MDSRSSNAYASGASQNTGNVITGRRTTRVLAPPGGASSISFGYSPAPAQVAHTAPKVRVAQAVATPAVAVKPTAPVAAYTPAGAAPATKENTAPMATAAVARRGVSQNAFASGASQNTGNFISDRPSSRVLSAPGGRSSIVLG